VPEVADYCRQLETYLCQKNGGHLIRIVGPAFDHVRAWAERGIPLTVAQRGIDRYCERVAAKQKSRTRPVRIEFCEPDILDVFDEWRRAVGVGLTSPGDAPPDTARKPPLTAHFERIVARLIARRIPSSPAFERHLEILLVELDRLAVDSRHARGDLRAGIVERLATLDRELMKAAVVEVDGRVAALARQEAEDEIAPFASRMAPEVRANALQAAYERLIRESLGLPIVRYG
jgi:hypothetical protein